MDEIRRPSLVDGLGGGKFSASLSGLKRAAAQDQAAVEIIAPTKTPAQPAPKPATVVDLDPTSGPPTRGSIIDISI